MSKFTKIAAVGMALFAFAGCVKQTTTEKPAPVGPSQAQPMEMATKPVTKAAADAPTKGLVVALPFTKDTGSTVPGGVDVRPAGQPARVDAGRFGSGCRLENGATLCVPTLNMTAEGTWGLWVHPDAKQAESQARIMDANAFGLILTGRKLAAIYHDGQSRSLPGPDVPSGQWTHLAMTWGDGSLKLYVNGELHGHRVIKGAPGFPRRKLFIGSRWTGSTLTFTGTIDDVVIYNRAISADEMKALVAQGLK